MVNLKWKRNDVTHFHFVSGRINTRVTMWILIVQFFYNTRVTIISVMVKPQSLLTFNENSILKRNIFSLKENSDQYGRWIGRQISFNWRFDFVFELSRSKSKSKFIHCWTSESKSRSKSKSKRNDFLQESRQCSDINTTKSRWTTIRLWMSRRTRLLSVLATNELDCRTTKKKTSLWFLSFFFWI